MHAMFPPKQRKAYPENKHKFFKPSIMQSIEAFVQIINSAEDIKEKLIELRQQYGKVGLSLQPKIFKIRNYDDGKYVVIYKEYYYSFNEFLLAVDCCFKLFFVFNAEYPFESIRFWKFVSIYFYNLPADDRDVISAVKEFKLISSNI